MRLERATLHRLLGRLVRTRGVGVEVIDRVIDALKRFRQGGDLAEHLIAARAGRAGALPLLSFDQRSRSHEGVRLLGDDPPPEPSNPEPAGPPIGNSRIFTGQR